MVNCMEIIGHRGAAFDAPENTLASFRLAWEQGADAIECDVWLSKDGRIVAIHDDDTARTAGIKELVADLPFEELHRFDVGRWRGQQFAGEVIPSLAEILETVPSGKRIFIEVKCGPEIVPELNRVVSESGLANEQIAVISFSTDVINAVKAGLPSIAAYWCIDLAKLDQSKPRTERSGVSGDLTRLLRFAPCAALIATAKSIGANGLDLSASPTITPDFVQSAKTAGLPIYVWTVNDPIFAKQLIAAGVAGITTDRPAWLRSQLKM
jgi:glycerophosphoryl diester phosphodiesterase